MKCFSGIRTTNGLVPCGQCMSCRINTGRKWTSRLLMEWHAVNMQSPHSWMLTLTYRPEDVPSHHGQLTLRKSEALAWVAHQQRFWKKFRYFIVGEYGDGDPRRPAQLGRPHYHMGVFGLSYDEQNALRDTWPYGHTSWSEMDEVRAAYLCQYTAKKLTRPDHRDLPEGVEPEFRTSTRVPPIGAPFLASLANTYRRGKGKALVRDRGDIERTIRFRGKIYPLDRWSLSYLRRELGIPLRHTDRMAHPNYLDFHHQQEAICNTEEHDKREARHAATAKIKKQITTRVQ